MYFKVNDEKRKKKKKEEEEERFIVYYHDYELFMLCFIAKTCLHNKK